MTALLRPCVCLRTLLLLSALLKICQGQCLKSDCDSNKTETLTTTTTTLTFEYDPNCTLSIGNDTFENGSITGLVPGAVYHVNLHCLNCCKEVTMKPEVVRDLTVSEVTTSSVSLTWTEPEGNSSSYRVQWTDGSDKTINVTETSKTITGLTPGVKYNITVTAVADDGRTEGEKVTISNYTKPEAVRNPHVSGLTTSSVSLTWTEPEGESSFYRVQWTNGNVTQIATVNQTHINISNLTAGVHYDINITAVAGDGVTDGESATVSQYTKPEAVRNPHVSGLTTSSVSLTWTEPEGESSFYRVQWTNGNVTQIATVNQTHINISNLTAGVHYGINVTAVAGDGVTDGESATVSQYTKPEAVRNPHVSGLTTSSVSLTWTEPEGESSFYRVQWTNGNVTQIATVNQTHINISNLTAGVHYDINITAVAGDGVTDGECATVSQYTKPEAVRNPHVSGLTTSSVSLTWTEPEGESSFYRVQWTNGNVTQIATVNQTHINISNLTAGVHYGINVTAVAGDGVTDGESATVSQYTKPEAVRNPHVSGLTTSTVSLTWTEPEGESSFYRVQWTNGNVTQITTVNQTHINISNLTAGVHYGINVTAVAGDGVTDGESATVSQYTKPEAVRNPHVSGLTTSSVSLTWTEPEGESSFYRVQWTNGNVTQIATVNQTHINISNLTAGVHYDINITAVAGDGVTDGECATVSQYTKPEAVRNPHVSGLTTSSVSLTWTEPEGESSFYRVQWTNGNVTQIATVNQTHINISNLTAGVHYGINVTAVAGDGVTDGESATVSQYTKPEAVRNPHVSGLTTSSVSLTWTEPEGESSFYRVQWTNGNVTQITTVNQTHINISNLIAGVHYDINITAVAGDGVTDGESATVSQYTKPEAVRNPHVSGLTTSSVSLTWTEPEGESSFYRVQWTNGNVTQIATVNQTHINISNLTAGVHYGINVTAVAGDGVTDGESATVSQYTKPEAVRNPHVSGLTTSSVSLTWTEPEGESSFYRVQWIDENVTQIATVNQTHINISNLIAGVHYDINITAVAGDGVTDGESATVSQYTMPKAVTNLTAEPVNTTSIRLTWDRQSDHKPYYSYLVTAFLDNSEGHAVRTETETYTFFSLLPGTLYHFKVTTSAGGVESAVKNTSSYTKPEKPEDIRITARGTDWLKTSWTLPNGRVDHYEVHISNEDLSYSWSDTTTFITAQFTALNPGRIFVITVTAVAGGFKTTSDQFSFATVPTPPGPIVITSRTNSSLHLQWATPEMMDGAPNISYHITYTPEDGEEQNEIVEHTDIELLPLFSGTLYKVAVETIGPQDLRSTAVRNCTFTLPNPVLNLVASPKSTTSIEVQWSHPQGYQAYYNYSVQAFNATEAMVTTLIVSTNSTDVLNLEPGTKYIIIVTVKTNGSESAVEQTFSYTMPKAVTNLAAEPVNTTSIRLTWDRQSDHKPHYSYLVTAFLDNSEGHAERTETETYTFFSLLPGTLYHFKVTTSAGGVESAVKSTSSYTMPEAVPDITAIGSTTNMSVSWTQANGRVDSYTVQLYRDGQLVIKTTDLSNTTVNTLFQGLTPGVIYDVVVITTSGTLESNNASIRNATFPNPPGPIRLDSQTVGSINFTWAFPEDMDHNQYSFRVITHEGSTPTENNWFLLDSNLESGSPYSISVVTVGVLNFKSTAVTAENYTKPYPVTMLAVARITTNAVTVVWEQQESKPFYSYVVQPTNGTLFPSKETLNTSETITGLLSGTNYSFTVTTQTADGTQADSETVSCFTRPLSVRELEAETLNTTDVRLVWLPPLDYKAEYTYRAWLIDFESNQNQSQNLSGQVAQFSQLNPGTNYTFCVFVLAGDGIEGEAKCTSQFTKPERVQPNISSQGSNSSMLVSWIKPLGRVEHYKVYLNNTASPLLLESKTSFLFEELSAGRLYTAMVATCSGTFNASSDFVTNATFPNPPGPIEILSKTTSSIDIRWQEAPLMAGASFQYYLTNTLMQGGKFVPSTITSHTFASLLSGTSYNISVATVGPMGFKSEKVQIHMVTTRPFSVKDLMTSTFEEDIIVTWDAPDEYKDSYRYNVTWQTSDGPQSRITGENLYNIDKLVPGTHYDFCVTTETFDGTQGDPRCISSCTNASSVTNLQCETPNKPNAEVILTWSEPTGHYSSFKVTVNDHSNWTSTNTCCSHTVSGLSHYTEYRLTVETQSCGKSSSPVSRLCRTGITNPPIPVNYESLLEVYEVSHDRFSLRINSSLLDPANGLVTHVGVLVTDNLPGHTDDLTMYLGKTYAQWKASETPVYLATVQESIPQSRSGEHDLYITVGDNSKWAGYTNGPLFASGKFQYAIVLFTNLTLQNNLVSVGLSLVSTTGFSTIVKLPLNTVIIGIAVGATLGIFFILFIILVGFIIYWKRFSTKESPDIQIYPVRPKVSVAVRVEDYEAYYRKQKADSNCGFAEEFEDLKVVGTSQSKTNALTLENKPKNRYNNVLPYDSSRVKLSIIHGSPYDDYINANYMPGYNSRKEFIAAQGPLPTTVNEFWRMIWEKNVQTLVMLTRCNEQGRVKCEQYWDSGTKHFGNITVTTTSAISLEDWTIRDFNVKNVKTAETRSVRHFHFTAWPDHGVPETTELLISFRHLVREHMDQYSRHSPTVVHCSAGVGRTGTFIAIDRLIFQIERENIVDVYGIVHDLRMHRPLMVQTEDQYVFLNQCAMDIIRSRTGTNVDLIYQNTAALSIYENVEPKKGFPRNGYHNA